jgi:5-methylcytosine-specific restriction protein A
MDGRVKASLKACTEPGCPSTTGCSADNCIKKKQGTHRTVQRTSTGALRSSAMYHSARWRKLRKAFISKHPLCVRCLSYDIITAATDVDHVIAVVDDINLRWRTSNMQPLCKSCHSVKTSNERMGKDVLDYRHLLK